MENSNVMKTRELDLCVSCEICSAVCPEDAIPMEYKFGQFLPKIDCEKCKKCGLCLELCPGIDIDSLRLSQKNIISDGSCLKSCTAYSNNFGIRKNSTSGGLITNLIIELIRNKEFDAAFVLDFDKFDGKPARLKATNNINEILKAAKSKYVPASVYNIIKSVRRKEDKKFIIVGTPCQIYGIKKFIKKFNISEENLLFLGLFCEKTLNFNIIQYFEDIYGKSNEKLVKLEFRTKEKHGWPGNSKIHFNSGKELIIDRGIRIQLKRFFQLNRCLFCLDKLNRLADISFGDCYIEGKSDFLGKSNVIVKTRKGKEVFDKYSHLFTLERESIEKIRESQHLMDKKDNIEYVKIFIKKDYLYPDTVFDYEINIQTAKRLLKLQRYINWGKNYNINKIRCFLFLSEIVGKLRTIGKRVMRGAAIGIAIGEDFFRRRGGKRYISKSKTGNIIIVGGELFNKGAQAMTFTVVDQMRRRFPDKNIYLFSTIDFSREDKEKDIYSFNILPWDSRTKIRLLIPLGKFFKNSSEHFETRINEVIKNADFFIDISGYALSSQWNESRSFTYLRNIMIAKKYSIPYYIFPQSIGPFDYPLKHKIPLYLLMEIYLKYPERIYAREEEGSTCVRKFTKKNVKKSYDIVLQNREYDLNNIYKKAVYLRNIKIEPNSVGIIPNLIVFERTNSDDIYSIYKLVISKLIDAKKTVYILRHSYDDLIVCDEIKRFFQNNKNVKLITDDLNAIELENIIKQFDFVIASRYHSIIHAYKNGIPALVIGWATKYFELLKDFDQLDYFFDCRNDTNINEINNRLDKMIRNCKYEREIISDKMNILNKENIFDIFGEDKC
jgi:coenzyme F420-reducing hydrogenase beta subunit/polysaccharide pyruvyl transferase WcaK-like protein